MQPFKASLLTVLVALIALSLAQPHPATASPRAQVAPAQAAATDWPQFGHDAQRTNYTPTQVNAPYCYAWKWYGVPMASRAQAVVVGNRLFIGGMDGALHARDATTGAPLWTYQTGGPIRHSAGVLGAAVIFSSHDGFTYALNVTDGALLWKTATGASATATLVDEVRGWVYAASTYGKLTALNAASGAKQWEFDAGAPILTSPSLSLDGSKVFLGNEAIEAIAVNAQTGALVWRTTLQGQSLFERAPVVVSDTVIYRSQPLHFFHYLLSEGDTTMDSAGVRETDWAADWAKVRPRILDYLTTQPSKQSLFALNANTGAARGVAPVLYTYGNNDVPNMPVARGVDAFVTYRARHGIQTDGGAIHVTSKYDAELGQMNPTTLDITGLRQASNQQYNAQFRMTSDEPGMLTMGGDILYVDNWERLGGLNVNTGQLVHVGNVSNVWPECYGGTTCGPDGPNPFFPLKSGEQAYPFPWPRVTDGASRSGVVVANNMLYWRVIEGGLAGIKSGGCGAPQVWVTDDAKSRAEKLTAAATPSAPQVATAATAKPAAAKAMTPRASLPIVVTAVSLSDYVTTDLTTPVSNPPSDLVQRLRDEIRAMLQLANGQHLMPIYMERGFSKPVVWPYNSGNCDGASFCMTQIEYASRGNVFWHDPGELLLTMAQAYPYLDAALQGDVRAYMSAEMGRYPPLVNQEYGGSWMTQGVARERYAVPFRNQLNNWPPVGANFSAIYAVWLWSKNTGDWTYACTTWPQAKALFNARRNTIRFYSDIAGAIGYARLAKALRERNCAGVTDADYTTGLNAAVAALTAGQGAANFNLYAQRAENDYLDPRDIASGFSAPVFFGMTPEIGRFLREQTGDAATAYLTTKQTGDGVIWWYITRVGVHAEDGETSFMLPWTGWSHFLARAYVAGDAQADLRKWLDRPWAVGDPYSIQKIVATIHAR
jgi:hypothetical protein